MASTVIHHAVTRQAQLRPDTTAVVDRDELLTYGELEHRASARAAQLRRQGTHPGVIVPVLLPRSADLVVTLLAILKCGAAYTVLDPRAPKAYLDQTVRRLATPPVVEPDSSAASASVAPTTDVGGGSPACVFFTSGTTGVPKGVVSPHEATTRLFVPGGPLEMGPTCVMPLAAATSWDAFSLELWGMLLTGGTAVVVREDQLMPGRLGRLIADHGVNTLWLTASLFNVFVDEKPRCFTGLRSLYIGGERLSVVHVRRFLDQHPNIPLYNGYGPVETCVFATLHHIRPEDCAEPDGVPIGRAVPGTTVHVLRDGEEVQAGTVGELCVSGSGLALGYLGDTELDRREFGRCALNGGTRRVYRTGDLGYLGPDGAFRYVGRKDRQIKVRGHRIELAEIETQAAQLPWIARCVAMPLEHRSGSFRGVALFYVPTPDRPATEQQVREALVECLPSYAVPEMIKRMADLPMTSNGKTDTRALLNSVRASGRTRA